MTHLGPTRFTQIEGEKKTFNFFEARPQSGLGRRETAEFGNTREQEHANKATIERMFTCIGPVSARVLLALTYVAVPARLVPQKYIQYRWRRLQRQDEGRAAQRPPRVQVKPWASNECVHVCTRNPYAQVWSAASQCIVAVGYIEEHPIQAQSRYFPAACASCCRIGMCNVGLLASMCTYTSACRTS